jgi:hypothetical protein
MKWKSHVQAVISSRDMIFQYTQYNVGQSQLGCGKKKNSVLLGTEHEQSGLYPATLQTGLSWLLHQNFITNSYNNYSSFH